MIKKYLSHIQKYNVLDLVVFAVYQFRMKSIKLIYTPLFKIKCMCALVSLKKGSQVWGKVIINKFPGSCIEIGRNLRVVSDPARYAFNIYPQSKIRTMSPTAKIIIGDDVGFNAINILARSQTIYIGSRTMIGGNCQIMDSDCHPLWPPESRWHYPGNEYDKSVRIGKDVFIGLNVMIMRGAVIGDNSVIAAGSVVSGDIPPNCLAAGAPAKVIKVFEN